MSSETVTTEEVASKPPVFTQDWQRSMGIIERRAVSAEKSENERKQKDVARANLKDSPEFREFMVSGDAYIAQLQQDYFDMAPDNKAGLKKLHEEIHYARKFWRHMKTKVLNTRE